MSEDLLTQCVAVIEDLLQRRPAQRSYRIGRQLIHTIRSKEAMAAKAAQKEHAADLAAKRMRAKLASPEAQEANDWAGELDEAAESTEKVLEALSPSSPPRNPTKKTSRKKVAKKR